MPALGRPTALALPAHAPAQLPAQLPAHVAWCVYKISHFFTPGAPVVGAAAASCQVHEMGVGGLLLRLAWQRPAAGWCYIGPDRRCLGEQRRVGAALAGCSQEPPVPLVIGPETDGWRAEQEEHMYVCRRQEWQCERDS